MINGLFTTKFHEKLTSIALMIVDFVQILVDLDFNLLECS